MSITEKIEISLIPLIGLITWGLAPELPKQSSIGGLILIASVLLLCQSLIRDIWLLYKGKQNPVSVPQTEAQCMCIESTVGLLGVLLGALLPLVAVMGFVNMPVWLWSLLTITTLGFGYLVKDYVLEWNPWRIRKEPEHLNTIFIWKSQNSQKSEP